MPNGKPAGVRCAQLNSDETCDIFGEPSRPLVCQQFRPDPTTCGETREEAIEILTLLEAG